MTYTTVIALNVILSLLAVGVVAGSMLLTHLFSDEPALEADWRDWGTSLPVALATGDGDVADELAAYPVAA